MQSAKITISKEEMADMPTVQFSGKITVADTIEGGREAIEELSGSTIVGFDTETKPSFQKGQVHKVALIQISTADHSYLFRVCRTGFFPELKNFLESDKVKKIGLSVKDDYKVLARLESFNPKGFVDLQGEVESFGIGAGSLQKIYAIIFGERISKSQRLTNWEAPMLTPSQCHYAAVDAWACLRIYETLHSGSFDSAACFGHIEADPIS